MTNRSASTLAPDDVARFLALHRQFEELLEAWATVRHTGAPNDHTNAEYDAAVFENLAHLHNATEPTLAAFADADDRFTSFGRRLEDVLLRVQDGETNMFTTVGRGSYQDVWMELHELVHTAGLDRAETGHR